MPFKSAVYSLITALFLAACGKAREAPVVQSPLVGSETVTGLNALQDTVMARALRQDSLGLLRITLNDESYRMHVWPVSVAYEPDREEVWNFVNGIHKANSLKGMRRLMADIRIPDHGPVETPDFQKIEVSGGTLYFAAKRERERGGIRMFGSALCLGEACQVVSYNQGGAKGGSPENDADRTRL